MNIKSEKGITGIDITIAVIFITIFVTIITSLFYLSKLKSTQIARKKEATSIAIEEIEKIKSMEFENLESNNEYYIDENNEQTPYYKEITVIDYADLPENKGQNKVKNLVKKVTVKISYNVGAATENVEISTAKKREN